MRVRCWLVERSAGRCVDGNGLTHNTCLNNNKQVFNGIMGQVFDKDPRKARPRVLALAWLAEMFGAESAAAHRKYVPAVSYVSWNT